MSKNVKRGLVILLSVLGLIALLAGIFTDIYSFGYGLIFAVAFWIAAVALVNMTGAKSESRK